MIKLLHNKIFLIFIILLISFISLFIGVDDLNLFDDEDQINLLLTSRIPRLLSILVVGASLAVCGVVIQQLSANSFVSPSTSSITDWAKLGIIIAILIMPTASVVTKTLISFGFAMFGSVVFIIIIQKLKFKDVIFIPLIGIFLGSIVSSISMFFAYQYNLVQNVSSFMQGSFSLVMEGRYEILFGSIPALILIYLYANKWTITALGKETALNLGLNYYFIVNLGLFLVAFITSIVVATIGILPFIGVIIPNIVRIFMGDNLKKTLPIIAIFGAFYVLICDILARVIIYPYEVPISLISGVIGAVLFLKLVLKKNG